MRYLLIVLVAGLLTGCALDNPLGMTDRQSIRANAYVEAARAQADATKAVAEQETIRTGIMAGMAIPVLLIVGGVILAGLVINWQGRIWLARTNQAPVMQAPALPRHKSQQIAELRRLAAQQGYSVQVVDSVAYLVDAQGQRRGRKLLAG